jgi:hypothetical protein
MTVESHDLRRLVSFSRYREPPLGGVAIQGGRTAAWCALPWIASSLRSSQ